MNAAGVGRRGLVLALLGAAAIGVGLACIIPDRDIQVFTTDINQYPVHFVEGIPIDEDARCACDPETCECPLPAFTALPTFLDPSDYELCICGENKIDAKQLPGVSLYIEDQDEVDGEPADKIYAAALLDWDPTLGDAAFDYVAYRSYLDPRDPLDVSFSSYELEVLKRPRPYVRSLTLSDANGFDLCNGAGRPVAPGFHTLSVMVTDRQWFQREATLVDSGDATTGGDPLESMAVVLEGVPNIAAGATYDIQTYVFQCLEETDEKCGCADITDP
ncbi:hypothetical protein ENSA5_34890 [Enhygromyxa salina]|uniref:Uncharacterized protein n=1 Tax=Enhygromyxa salina TaxID=215803 RepID=A0A2S9XW67_9BACT|nr:hypothetical protein [Enhygromyxa salina]PRP97106.1 hypothetical protein ENSA5_34890 [Enhygromyxa salina]